MKANQNGRACIQEPCHQLPRQVSNLPVKRSAFKLTHANYQTQKKGKTGTKTAHFLHAHFSCMHQRPRRLANWRNLGIYLAERPVVYQYLLICYRNSLNDIIPRMRASCYLFCSKSFHRIYKHGRKGICEEFTYSFFCDRTIFRKVRKYQHFGSAGTYIPNIWCHIAKDDNHHKHWCENYLYVQPTNAQSNC
jgi:hypothetical protein